MSTQNQINDESPLDFFEKESVFHSIFDPVTISHDPSIKNPLWTIVPSKFDYSSLGQPLLCGQFQKKAKAIGCWVKRYYFLFENHIAYASSKSVNKIKKYLSLEGLKVWIPRGEKTDDKEPLSTMLGFFRSTQAFILKVPSKETQDQWIERLRTKCIMINVSHFYTIQHLLGKGSYGKVYMMQSKADKKTYAAKVISKNQMITRLLGLDTLYTEIKNLRKVNHPNIVKLKEVFETPSSIYLIMDYVEGEELKTYLQTKGKFTEEDCVPIMKNILETVHYLHENKIIHRDLKLENILIPSNTTSEIKLIDFGLSVDLTECREAKRGGTPGYIAPEVLKAEASRIQVDPKCDMFSLGCLFYRLLTGGKLFLGSTAKEVLENNKECYINPSKISFLIKSIQARNVLMKMLEADPLKRISAAEALDHPFFNPDKIPSFTEFLDSQEEIKIAKTSNYAFDMSQIKETNIFSSSRVFDSNGTICMAPHIPHDNLRQSTNLTIPLKSPLLGLTNEFSCQTISVVGTNYAGESSIGSCMTPTRLNFDERNQNFGSASNSPMHMSPSSRLKVGYSPVSKSSFSNNLARKIISHETSPVSAGEFSTPGSKRLAFSGGFGDFVTQFDHPNYLTKKLVSIGETREGDSSASNNGGSNRNAK